MKGIALFAPDKKSYEQANEILKEEQFSVEKCKLITTDYAIEEAEVVLAEGTDIIIARGRQATKIQRNTKAIVVEICLTAQELGLLVVEAKKLSGKECPRIGLFGWGNTLSDTAYFNELYHVDLRRYILHGEEDHVRGILAMERDELDVVIAGEGMLKAAEAYGIPGVYLAGTGESVRIALQHAENTLRVLEKQQYSENQLAYALDVMNQGVVRVDKDGVVSFVNATMDKILRVGREKVVGYHYSKYLKGMDEGRLSGVFGKDSEGCSFFYKYHGDELFVMADPVVIGTGNDGALLVFTTAASVEKLKIEKNRLPVVEGEWVCRTFDDINKNMKNLQGVVEKAKLFAKSSSPILIEGGSGSEMEIICEGIHSFGNRSQGPYYMINITGMNDEEQRRVLFGEHGMGEEVPGMLEKAHLGTLVLGSVDKLSLQNQYKLVQCIRNKILPDSGSWVDTRIIAYSSKNLSELRDKFLFRADLFFVLKSLKLRIPSLQERREDVNSLLDEYMQQYMKLYERYHVLTGGARRVLLEYPWEGNSVQMQSFCERMILTANKRSITEEYVRALLHELYEADKLFIAQGTEFDLAENELFANEKGDPMRNLINQTLRKYNGNRTLTAKELRISTTTLWRKMKKYGLD